MNRGPGVPDASAVEQELGARLGFLEALGGHRLWLPFGTYLAVAFIVDLCQTRGSLAVGLAAGSLVAIAAGLMSSRTARRAELGQVAISMSQSEVGCALLWAAFALLISKERPWILGSFLVCFGGLHCGVATGRHLAQRRAKLRPRKDERGSAV